ncbi:variable surface protein [Plasmodium gonderi]|uniref:Variable surface protein n=1 Tax=Plasmodium gonderi TaxID=77519 RepID=A0A1Y1JUI7_PLAGO|nr:variable surface protein [Plasmodium gonderi]GAW84412.1 variable surface protein [Plasmodium gonderi]
MMMKYINYIYEYCRFYRILSKFFFNTFNADNTYIARTERLLAKNIFQRKYKQESLKVNLKLFNPKYNINNGSHEIASIYKDMELLDDCVNGLLLDEHEKFNKHVVKAEISNKTLERAIFNDYPKLHAIPLSNKIATILCDYTGKKIHEIALESTNNSLVIILTHKCNSKLYGKYTELNNVAFLTIMVICLSQILYIIGKFDFLDKNKTPQMREKEIAKEKKMEIKKKRKKDMLKYKEILKKDGIKDLDTYMKYYKQRYYSKKGIGKFDSYCEKYIFDMIDRIDKISECSNYENRRMKKKICVRYGLYGTIFCLFQLSGIIYPLTSKIKKNVTPSRYILSILGLQIYSNQVDSYQIYDYQIYATFIIILSILILVPIIYIMIKMAIMANILYIPHTDNYYINHHSNIGFYNFLSNVLILYDISLNFFYIIYNIFIKNIYIIHVFIPHYLKKLFMIIYF